MGSRGDCFDVTFRPCELESVDSELARAGCLVAAAAD
jgi:hypothetical protein